MSQSKSASVFLLIVLAAALGVAVFSKLTGPNRTTPDPIGARKQQILSVVSGGTPLSLASRYMLYRALSGRQVEEYNFTSAEKAAIINSLNRQ